MSLLLLIAITEYSSCCTSRLNEADVDVDVDCTLKQNCFSLRGLKQSLHRGHWPQPLPLTSMRIKMIFQLKNISFVWECKILMMHNWIQAFWIWKIENRMRNEGASGLNYFHAICSCDRFFRRCLKNGTCDILDSARKLKVISARFYWP